MRILVTAGNTQTPVDRVRCLTNIFTGRTGAQIAAVAAERGHTVTLFTSHPETIVATESLRVRTYRTFEDLHALMADTIPGDNFDAIVHAAAVGDYLHAGSYALAPAAKFDAKLGAGTTAAPQLVDVAAGKLKGNHSELWLRFTPAPKLIDLIRDPWGFRGILVKFKLEVGLTNDELLKVAEHSRRQSRADLLVANTLERRHDEAFIGASEYVRVDRPELPAKLIKRLEEWTTSRQLQH